MIQKILNNKFQIGLLLFSIVGLALIRNFESALFYDPFLNFFKGTFSTKALPELVEWKLYLNLFLRYSLNMVLSILILQTLFKNSDFIKLASVLYLLFFILLMLLLIIVLQFFSDRLMLIFYIRRFLIQPLFLLLFIPGFYFQQNEQKNKINKQVK
jgi:exosortase F-associated protein